MISLLISFFLATALNAVAQPQIQIQQVAAGLSSPLYLTHAGDGSGRLFVVERGGLIRIIQNGSVLPGSYLDIRAKVLAGGERGLLGLAFHPNYETNGRFYVNYTRAGDGATVVSRFYVSPTDPNAAVATSETILLIIPQPESNHNGGYIAFGPDGYLYIAMGDGGGGGDNHGPIGNGQSTTTLLGKILRIDVNTGSPYAIPPDNPFANGVGGRPEIFALGFRNPWRCSFDRTTGRLFAGDVGQNAIEEIDIVVRGGNYGWRRMEGSQCFNPSTNCQTGNLLLPIHEYPQVANRCSVTGGYVYRGTRSPSMNGWYFYGDFCTGEIFALEETGPGAWTNFFIVDTSLSLASFGEDEAGELYICDLGGGTIQKILGPVPTEVKNWEQY